MGPEHIDPSQRVPTSFPVKHPKITLTPLSSELPSRQAAQLDFRILSATSSSSTNQPLGTESKNISCPKIAKSSPTQGGRFGLTWGDF